MTVTYKNVTVNFNVNIDASGNIEVFGKEAYQIENKVVAKLYLPTSTLYSYDSSLNYGSNIFSFWEPSDALGTRKAELNGTNNIAFFAYYLSKVLKNEMDGSDADPFNQTKYLGTPQYYTHDSFGRLALSAYAHYLFGHVAATAAITNDQDFISRMNNYKYLTTGSTSDKKNDFEYVSSTSYTTVDNTTANLAKRLAHAVATTTETNILDIVEQVIGQDASRTMDLDNNELAPNVKIPLRFYDGDKIYININLVEPSIIVQNGQQNAPQSSLFNTDSNDNNGALNRNYTIELTLKDLILPTPTPTIGFTDDTLRNYTVSFTTNDKAVEMAKTVTGGSGTLSLITDIMNYAPGLGPANATSGFTSITANSQTYTLRLHGGLNAFYYRYVNKFMLGVFESALGNAIVPSSQVYNFNKIAPDFTITNVTYNSSNNMIDIRFTSSRIIPNNIRIQLRGLRTDPNLISRTVPLIDSVFNFNSILNETSGQTGTLTSGRVVTTGLGFTIQPGNNYMFSISANSFNKTETNTALTCYSPYDKYIIGFSNATATGNPQCFGGSDIFELNSILPV